MSHTHDVFSLYRFPVPIDYRVFGGERTLVPDAPAATTPSLPARCRSEQDCWCASGRLLLLTNLRSMFVPWARIAAHCSACGWLLSPTQLHARSSLPEPGSRQQCSGFVWSEAPMRTCCSQHLHVRSPPDPDRSTWQCLLLAAYTTACAFVLPEPQTRHAAMALGACCSFLNHGRTFP